jgi:hypothetical protein
MLELKNHLLASSSNISIDGLKTKHVEIFNAMQRLSLFMINRTSNDTKYAGIDDQSKTIVKSIFNENASRMLEYYEQKNEK